MSERNDVIVGVFVLAGVAVVVGGAVWLGGAGWGQADRTLTARFADVGQLRSGSSVTVRGVPVGRVESVTLGPGGGVDVRMWLRETAPVPEQPVAVIRPSSLFGQWEVGIVPASTVTEVDVDGLPRPEGGIPGYAQADFAQMSEFTSDIAENLSRITDRMEVAFNERTAENLASSVENFEQASQELVGLMQQQRKGIGAFADDMGEAGNTVREAAAKLDSTMGRLEQATREGEIQSIFQNSEQATARLNRLTEELRTTTDRLNGVLARADTTFSGAREVVDRVNRGEGALGRLMADTALYERTAATLSQLRALLQDLRESPNRYFQFSIF